MASNSIRHKAESAVAQYLSVDLIGTAGATVVTSDRAEDLPDKPYVLVTAMRYEEQFGPGTGIFKVDLEIKFSSHVRETSAEQREEVVTAINNFTYSSPASTISQADGFYCHGIVPTSGEMQIDTDEKSYDYVVNYEMHCMPRDNT